jgi:hypothetical protein
MRGERPLPDTPGPMTVDATAAPYLADNTGAQDATRAIQRALDAVGSAGGGTVYLPAGTYLVRPQGEDDFALRIAYDGVLLKGAGVGQTFTATLSSRSGKVQIFESGETSYNYVIEQSGDQSVCVDNLSRATTYTLTVSIR